MKQDKTAHEVAECRISVYVDFLMAAYGCDLRGLADIAGIPRQTLTKFMNAPYEQKGIFTLGKLAGLTGVSLGWLVADDVEGADNAVS